MAPFALLSGRRLAQTPELASPLVGTLYPALSHRSERESDAISPPSASMVFPRSTDTPVSPIPALPSTTAGLIGFISFLAAAILIFGSWKVIKWRRKRREPRKSSFLPSMDPMTEKRFRPLILVPPVPNSPSVKWVPAKISPWIDPRMPRRPTPSLNKDVVLNRPESYPFNRVSEKAVYVPSTPSDPSHYPSSADSTVTLSQSDPPSTVFLDAIESKLGVSEIIQEHKKQLTTTVEIAPLSIPPGLDSSNSSSTSDSEVETAVDSESSSESGSQTTSSPTASAESDSTMASSECSAVLEKYSQPGFPKLVIVKRTFPTNLPDELKVKEGERLRVLREFKDGWTLCQRTSRRNPEKGAVPGCCLVELSVNTARAKAGRRRDSRAGVTHEKG